VGTRCRWWGVTEGRGGVFRVEFGRNSDFVFPREYCSVLTSDGIFFPPKRCLVRVRVKDRRGQAEGRSGPWDEGAGEVHKGHFHISAGEGGEEAVHVPTGVTYVTEKHFFLVTETLTHLDCVSSEGALVAEEVRDSTGPGEAEGWCLKN